MGRKKVDPELIRRIDAEWREIDRIFADELIRRSMPPWASKRKPRKDQLLTPEAIARSAKRRLRDWLRKHPDG